MIKKGFLGFVVCLSMVVVFLCAGEASAVNVPGVYSITAACTSDAGCDNGLFCDGSETCSAGACVSGTAPCSGSTSVCHEVGDECVECDVDGDCGGDTPVCNGETNECVECLDAATCDDDGNFCTGAPTCESNVCGFAGDPCADEDVTTFCNGTACIEPPECDVDSDCDDDGAFCNGPTICTNEDKCAAAGSPCEGATPECKEEGDGTCVECLSDDNCGSDTPLCLNNVCTECEKAADCYDGIFCNGVEKCVDGACVEGIDPCDFLGFACDEDYVGCVECLSDADCADEVFCNGDETCVEGACLPGSDPCAASETCIEETAECVAAPGCESDDDCADDVFCNGDETCVDGDCVAGSNPCAPDETCDEQAEECVLDESCETDADCDSDGVFCNGIEVCVLSAPTEATPVEQGVCESAGNPCEADEVCDEQDNICAVAPGENFLQVEKCTVKAGKKESSDSIKLSGLLDAEEADFTVGGDVVVIIQAEDIPDLNVTTFILPIEEGSLKKGKYKSPKDKVAPVASLKIDTSKGTISFSAKKADLTGVSCPIIVQVEIGDYFAEFEMSEEIVNGPKKDCPPELLE